VVISIISGKGGTGKTTVAVNLAAFFAENSQIPQDQSLLLMDCDVEEPNAALFLNPSFDLNESVNQPIPIFDEQICIHCGHCADVCQYHAIAVTHEKVIFFPELCHACGSCTLECPEQAITEIPDEVGVMQHGWVGTIEFVHGKLNIGYASPVPIIRYMKAKYLQPEKSSSCLVIIDASPGVTCPVVASLQDSDFTLLVTEPTPFGLHDLRQAYQLVHAELHIPAAVVINKCDLGDQGVENFCKSENIPVIMRIPFKREYGVSYSKGKLLILEHPELRFEFSKLADYLNRQQWQDQQP